MEVEDYSWHWRGSCAGWVGFWCIDEGLPLAVRIVVVSVIRNKEGLNHHGLSSPLFFSCFCTFAVSAGCLVVHRPGMYISQAETHHRLIVTWKRTSRMDQRSIEPTYVQSDNRVTSESAHDIQLHFDEIEFLRGHRSTYMSVYIAIYWTP